MLKAQDRAAVGEAHLWTSPTQGQRVFLSYSVGCSFFLALCIQMSISNSNLFSSAGADRQEAKSPLFPLPLLRGSSQPLAFSIPLSNEKHTIWRGTYLRNTDFSNHFFPVIDLWKTSSGFQLVIATYKKDSYGYNYFMKIENNFLREPFIFSNVVSCLLSHTPWDQPLPPFTFHLQFILCLSALTFSSEDGN